MARKQAKRRAKTKRKTKRIVQKGGAAPYYVNFNKGFNRTKDLIKALKTPVDKKKAIATVDRYKREYKEFKRKGGKKSYTSWGLDKGYMKRDGASSCCVM